MTQVTASFTPAQRNKVRQVALPSSIPSACPQNFMLVSECFGALVFDTLPHSLNESAPITYTIRGDIGLFRIDVKSHDSDFEQRILPLQWAVDRVGASPSIHPYLIADAFVQAIVQLTTGTRMPTPLEWPFTNETNEEQEARIRRSNVFSSR
jgi:ATP-binding cassette subfamily A (ABC1) protein 3